MFQSARGHALSERISCLCIIRHPFECYDIVIYSVTNKVVTEADILGLWMIDGVLYEVYSGFIIDA